MGYRDDRVALKERIEELEKKAANAVSPQELAKLRAELVESKERLEAEREALDGLLGQLDEKAPPRRRAVRGWLVFAVVVALAGAGILAVVVSGALVWSVASGGEPSYEGAPNAVRATPARREVDVELQRVMPDLDGCLPEGDPAEIQVEMLFEGHSGAVVEVLTRNVSEHDAYPGTTPECLERVVRGIGVPPFRNPTYPYHLTLRWSAGGGLQRPAIWDRYPR